MEPQVTTRYCIRSPSVAISGPRRSQERGHAPSSLSVAAAAADEGGKLLMQASDGQRVFVDALSARMLLEEHGSVGGCPETIAAPIVELTSHKLHREPRAGVRHGLARPTLEV